MRLVTDLTDRDVIHCSTKAQYILMMELLVAAGMSRTSYVDVSNWEDSKTSTCIFRNGSHTYLNYCMRKAYNIFPAGEFFPIGPSESVIAWSFDQEPQKRGLLSKIKSLFA